MPTAQLVFNGLTLGAAYALVALGFVLVLNATAAVNFAQGDLVMAGGMIAVALAPTIGAITGAPGFALLPLVTLLMAVMGVVLGLAAHRPLADRPPTTVFISTIAAGIILSNGALLIMGPEPRAAPPLVDGPAWELGGMVADRQGVAIMVVAAVLVLGVWALLTRTRFGRRMRAAAQDPEMARACGVAVPRLALAAFALSAALSGVAGMLLANRFFVTPSSGGDLMLKAYIAVTVGGWGSIPGAVAGGLLIALFEVGVSTWFSHVVATGALYAAALAILLWRPTGLFGEAARRRA